jgi:hypothetical protein
MCATYFCPEYGFRSRSFPTCVGLVYHLELVKKFVSKYRFIVDVVFLLSISRSPSVQASKTHFRCWSRYRARSSWPIPAPVALPLLPCSSAAALEPPATCATAQVHRLVPVGRSPDGHLWLRFAPPRSNARILQPCRLKSNALAAEGPSDPPLISIDARRPLTRWWTLCNKQSPASLATNQ